MVHGSIHAESKRVIVVESKGGTVVTRELGQAESK